METKSQQRKYNQPLQNWAIGHQGVLWPNSGGGDPRTAEFCMAVVFRSPMCTASEYTAAGSLIDFIGLGSAEPCASLLLFQNLSCKEFEMTG